MSNQTLPQYIQEIETDDQFRFVLCKISTSHYQNDENPVQINGLHHKTFLTSSEARRIGQALLNAADHYERVTTTDNFVGCKEIRVINHGVVV